MSSTHRDREIFLAGYEAAMRFYAVWRDGERFIGVMRTPLGQAIAKLNADPDFEATWQAAAAKLRENEAT